MWEMSREPTVSAKSPLSAGPENGLGSVGVEMCEHECHV